MFWRPTEACLSLPGPYLLPYSGPTESPVFSVVVVAMGGTLTSPPLPDEVLSCVESVITSAFFG